MTRIWQEGEKRRIEEGKEDMCQHRGNGDEYRKGAREECVDLLASFSDQADQSPGVYLSQGSILGRCSEIRASSVDKASACHNAGKRCRALPSTSTSTCRYVAWSIKLKEHLYKCHSFSPLLFYPFFNHMCYVIKPLPMDSFWSTKEINVMT